MLITAIIDQPCLAALMGATPRDRADPMQVLERKGQGRGLWVAGSGVHVSVRQA